MLLKNLHSRFLTYLIHCQIEPGQTLPPLNEISRELDMSVGKLREQLEVARTYGLVSVKPRVGIQRMPYTFSPALLPAVLFGLASGEASFTQFSRLRQAIEREFWDDAVILLTDADKADLVRLVESAWSKLRGTPVHVPNQEHRQLHLSIFKRLDNPFVQGMLQTYWDAYESSELTRFMRYEYWTDVWTYHENIVNALQQGEFEQGKQLLIQHFALLPDVSS